MVAEECVRRGVAGRIPVAVCDAGGAGPLPPDAPWPAGTPHPLSRPDLVLPLHPPFPGLTAKPPCTACEQAALAPAISPAPAPPPHHLRRGDVRARSTPPPSFAPMDTVPIMAGSGTAISRPTAIPMAAPGGNGIARPAQGYFLDTHGTPLCGTRVAVDRLVWAVGALAEGLGIRAVARVFEVDPHTVLRWLVEAAAHLQAFSQYFLHDVRVTQVQLDELYALLRAVKAGEVSEAAALQRLERSPRWVWVAMDPVTKLLLALDVGARTVAMAQHLVHKVGQVLAPDCVPLFLTDGFKEYATALLTHDGSGYSPHVGRPPVPCPSPAGGPCPSCCMRR